MDNTLLPCTHCGSVNVEDGENLNSAWVVCGDCPAFVQKIDGTLAEVRVAWNRRPAPPALNVERLVTALIDVIKPADVIFIQDEELCLVYMQAFMNALQGTNSNPKAAMRALVLAALQPAEAPPHDPISYALLQNPD